MKYEWVAYYVLKCIRIVRWGGKGIECESAIDSEEVGNPLIFLSPSLPNLYKKGGKLESKFCKSRAAEFLEIGAYILKHAFCL